ncbi:hypothetical protein [Kribbella sindirgiensis]|uniref:Uncharacterized protein n=1 Tax=Kribbella sindirgiensis TaxID=1124744 RepID=A0A4R0IBY4_9ACTN|nr:hypothetical protein [Kribbella sindirgiensis]TCC20570.1 hypothetical protein E0H50_36685 [Kribbella sindirgiensis]
MRTLVDPKDTVALQTRLRHLAEQLSLEYAGSVAPGRVLRLVFTTGHRLRRQGYGCEDLLRVTKSSVRADLTTLIGAGLSARSLATA